MLEVHAFMIPLHPMIMRDLDCESFDNLNYYLKENGYDLNFDGGVVVANDIITVVFDSKKHVSRASENYWQCYHFDPQDSFSRAEFNAVLKQRYELNNLIRMFPYSGGCVAFVRSTYSGML